MDKVRWEIKDGQFVKEAFDPNGIEGFGHESRRSPFIRFAGLVCCLRLVRINWPVIGQNKPTCDWSE